VNADKSFIDFDMLKKAWADWQKRSRFIQIARFWFYMREETPMS
jgi:hypothetical protein